MIIITGATGQLNGKTVEHLLKLMPAKDIAVVVRDTAKAKRFKDVGIEVRRGDYAEPTSLPTAFEGADQLLLVSSNDPGADAVSLHRNAINAAVQAGVGRILYTSHQGAALDSPFLPARGHAETEKILAESGVAWTALRNGFYMHSLNRLMGQWRETERITVPADGRISWTSREDAAEAAARILASNGKYDGPTTITASAAPTFQVVAEIASEIVGRKVELEVIGEDEWIASQIAAWQQEFMARFTLGIYQAADKGLFAGTDPLLGELLGREPKSVHDFLSEPPVQ